MKFFRILLVTVLGLASLKAQAPDHLSIGNVAAAEALVKAKTAYVMYYTEDQKGQTYQTVDLGSVQSIQDVMTSISSVKVSLKVTDPKGWIHVDGLIRDAAGNDIFHAESQFQLQDSFDPLTNKLTYKVPSYAGQLYFRLTDSKINVGSATSAYLVDRNGNQFNLDIVDGSIVLPGWANYNSMYSELVIDGNRYDMNTGLIMRPVNVSTFVNASFENMTLPPVNVQGIAQLKSDPAYGTVPTFQVNAQNGRLKVTADRSSYDNHYVPSPIGIQYATANDLRPGGRGWQSYKYSDNLDIAVPAGVYFVVPVYQDWTLNLYSGGGKG